MSGPIGSSQWMYNSSTGFYSYSIDQSLRFNDNDSAYLSRTPSSAGNRTTWTWSAWVKRGIINSATTQYHLFGGYTASNDAGYTAIYFRADEIRFTGHNTIYRETTQVFRDSSAWYHLVFVWDTSQGTASDRIKIYVNGVQITAFTTSNNPTSSQTGGINAAAVHAIGANTNSLGGSPFDGYMAEVNFIDGTALDPTSFGETINGVWVPKAYSGSYGTNGFYLPFDDSSAIGDDESGNTNDWTANNLAASDVMSGESPTNNFCTLNPLAYTNGITLSNGNLTMATTTNNRAVHGTIALPSSGKWYVELHVDSYASGGGTQFGWCTDASLGYDEYSQSKGVFFSTYNQAVTIDNSAGGGNYNTQGNNSSSNGDIYQLLLDVDNKVFYIGKNGTYRNSADPGNGTGGLDVTSMFTNAVTDIVFSATRGGSYNETYSINFGQDSKDVSSANADDNGIGTFEYAPPSGFLALCSANLPEPTIGPNAAEQADDYFDTILYTAASSNGTYTHGNLSFRPDFSWIKNRNNVERHFLTDVVRGNTSVTDKFLVSSDTSAEGTNGTSGTTFSVTDTGYEFVEASISSGELYYNSRTYVGWNWKAGGTAVSNTDGSTTSSVSAAPDAGFSIVQYEGLASGTQTVGHGLNSAPEFIIFKNIDDTSSWVVYSEPVGTSGFLLLNSTGAKNTSDVTNTFNSTSPTSSVFTVGTNNAVGGNGETIIAYCFHSVDGYSKVGSYVGNGSADGPFVYTGHRVKWLLVKGAGNTYSWYIHDSTRDTFNHTDAELAANSSGAEYSAEGAGGGERSDFLSNGFKVRTSNVGWNQSGITYIYLAIGDSFKYANAR